MWKKDDVPTTAFTPESEATPRPQLSVSPSAPAAQPAPTPARTAGTPDRATIGRSITIRGDVTGNEDLLIQGRVDGSIDLKQHAVTIGSEGEVKASIAGRVVIVEGSVEGNIISEEQVVLRSSARVKGDITAPRLVLEDGARFRGGVDMGEAPAINAEPASASSGQSQAKRAGSTGGTPSASDASGSSGTASATSSADKSGEKSDSAGDANGAKRKGGSEVVAGASA